MSGQRGFATWKPTAESRELVDQIQAVLREYADYLPLTGRQIFYRLVGAYGYEKSEKAANRLYGVLGRARRAAIIPFASIRDGGSSKVLPQTFDDPAAFWDGVRDDFEHYSRDRQAGQPTYVELFCEAPGTMPQLQRAAFPFSVPVYGTRGFSGLGVVADIALRAMRRGGTTTILQVGDFDPSGESIFRSMADDATAFVDQIRGGVLRGKKQSAFQLAGLLGLEDEECERLEKDPPFLETVRVALTPEQVEEHDLPTAPPSSKDSRSKSWVGETAQLEAMPPDVLAQTVRSAILEQFDRERYDEEVAAEEDDRDGIGGVLEEAGERW